ncbi:hypothetical protein HBH56_232690 [Parastagonospora nodorum]|nr:hypothetical protein HBH56_232690 [Parastagonospora nodorum]KAH3921392.1 hypothetical protein HBH54_240380 [Parastagonospora nodorum]KAH4125452.1 hypothetical protein HBH45_231490 [Parastagonospora nodorum]KAH4147773.1 hypothetical protein HBH44_219760 [Parastagonospora nodorum]KAH4555781.1 hypothetical protein HBH84_236200 [Parastagonospora nodorum]
MPSTTILINLHHTAAALTSSGQYIYWLRTRKMNGVHRLPPFSGQKCMVHKLSRAIPLQNLIKACKWFARKVRDVEAMVSHTKALLDEIARQALLQRAPQ